MFEQLRLFYFRNILMQFHLVFYWTFVMYGLSAVDQSYLTTRASFYISPYFIRPLLLIFSISWKYFLFVSMINLAVQQVIYLGLKRFIRVEEQYSFVKKYFYKLQTNMDTFCLSVSCYFCPHRQVHYCTCVRNETSLSMHSNCKGLHAYEFVINIHFIQHFIKT